jgi:1-acyl-sn-glycerol-3-phosphate acyltransferase
MRKAGRFILRAIWLVFEVSVVGLRFLFLFIRTGGKPSLRERSECLKQGCRRTLRPFVKNVEVRGPLPAAGLLVSNHLSYVDILLLGSLFPSVFVSKAEVKNWPVFGLFSRLGGTVYVQRERRGEVGRISDQLQSLLRDGHLVVLFPEGTSSDGESVLPFKSALLEPVVGWAKGIHAGCISYQLEDGVVGQDLCYWGGMTFLPHVVKLLTKSRANARVVFAPVREPATDRKQLAKQLHAQVLTLKGTPPYVEPEAELAAKSF